MQPNSLQINRILNLVWDLHSLVDRSCADVMGAVLATRTMERLGYKGSGHLDTAEQADACIRILEHWIEVKRDEYKQG